jgi:serine phosphatase RsbU (regulator of sigma subunit)
MAISKTLCKSLAMRSEGTPLDPGELMRLANREISRDNPEMFFVTAFIGVLDLRTGEFAYCNAGHDRPLVFAPGSAPAELDGASGPPVCIVEGFEYVTHRRQMAPGEFLCLFTDGVTEAFDRKQQPFGRERLEATLSGWGRDASSSRILDAVCQGVRAFARDTEPSDDLTVLVLRWTPSQFRNVAVAA